jgi:hypothetical protein
MDLRLMTVVITLAGVAHGTAVPISSATTQPRKEPTAPESFSCQLQARTGLAGAATTMRVQLDRYTADHDRKTVTDAMTHGGYPGFLQALRKTPVVGQLEFGDQKFAVRWARQQPAGKGRSIIIVTDTPVYFIGGGRVDAKPREGFEVAVVQFTVDDVGMGSGTMAAAARVKPDGAGGVVLEDYAEEPIKLTSVKRAIP